MSDLGTCVASKAKAGSKSWLVALVLAQAFFGCYQETAESPAKEARQGTLTKRDAATSELPERNIDSESLRNMSELLAGVLPEASGDDAISPVWQEHAAFMDEAWEVIGQRLDDMRAWADVELTDLAVPGAQLVYPFGGPDLISAMQFFPQAQGYMLIGLEAPGRLPMPERFSGEALAADLERLRRPFRFMVKAGYFVESEIKRDLEGGPFDGLLPILLICLVRAGETPLSFDYVEIDPETLEIRPVDAGSTTVSAVQIRFTASTASSTGEVGSDVKERPIRSVYYFAQDLSNDGLLSDDPFSRLVDHQQAINVYIKSAEYLPHLAGFSNFRDLMLNNASAVLQDDSGIPMRHFRSDRWQLQLYGKYTTSLAAYAQYFQKDLAAAFSRPGQAGKMDFTLGYQSETDGGNLTWARRLSLATGSDAVASGN